MFNKQKRGQLQRRGAASISHPPDLQFLPSVISRVVVRGSSSMEFCNSEVFGHYNGEKNYCFR